MASVSPNIKAEGMGRVEQVPPNLEGKWVQVAFSLTSSGVSCEASVDLQALVEPLLHSEH